VTNNGDKNIILRGAIILFTFLSWNNYIETLSSKIHSLSFNEFRILYSVHLYTEHNKLSLYLKSQLRTTSWGLIRVGRHGVNNLCPNTTLSLYSRCKRSRYIFDDLISYLEAIKKKIILAPAKNRI
jgi:hypothetical protein